MQLKKLCFIFCFIFITKAMAIESVASNEIFKSTPKKMQQWIKESHPLNEVELKKLLTNNTIIGHTTHTASIYEFYFKANGTVIFRKSRDNAKTYVGKWWVKDYNIFSQWKTYQKKPTVNHLQYFHIIDNIYIAYNIDNNVCGKKHQFCRPFMVFKGNPFHLDAGKPKQ